MLRSFIYTAFFALLLTGCRDGCEPDEKYISVFFKNQGDNDIHLFYKIYAVDRFNTIVTIENEEFDASNKLAPGYTRLVEKIVLVNFYNEANVTSYDISFYAGQNGVVFKSVKDMSIESSKSTYEAIWDGTNLQVNSFQ